MKPALTPEEWRDGKRFDGVMLYPVPGGLMVSDNLSGMATQVFDELFPALAAYALHGQSFGFTREDVDRLRGWRIDTETGDRIYRDEPSSIRWQEFADALADRIAALLPPEEP